MVWINSYFQRVRVAGCFVGFFPDTVTNSME